MTNESARGNKRRRKTTSVIADVNRPPGLESLVHTGHGIWTVTLVVVPKLARVWLEEHNYTDNRRISATAVKFYSRQSLEGRWKLNGESIIFDKAGGLLNGQHRLTVIVKTNKPMTLTVNYGVDTETFTTMDQHQPRGGKQVLGMAGYTHVSIRAAICRAIYSWCASNGSVPVLGGKIAGDELLIIQRAEPDRVDPAILWVDKTRRTNLGGSVQQSLLGLGHYLFSDARPRKAPEFLQILQDGYNAPKGHPALVYRNQMIQDKLRDQQRPREGKWWGLVQAWNAYDKGKTLTTIPIKREPETGNWIKQAVRGLVMPPNGKQSGQ